MDEFEKQWLAVEEAVGRAYEELDIINHSLRNRQLGFALRHLDKARLALETVVEHSQASQAHLQEARQVLIEKFRTIHHLDYDPNV